MKTRYVAAAIAFAAIGFSAVLLAEQGFRLLRGAGQATPSLHVAEPVRPPSPAPAAEAREVPPEPVVPPEAVAVAIAEPAPQEPTEVPAVAAAAAEPAPQDAPVAPAAAPARTGEPAPAPARPSPDRTPPSAPTAFTATLVAGTQVELRWTPPPPSEGAVRYEVAHAGAVVFAGKGTALQQGSLAPGAEHCWTVRAFDAAGNASDPAGPACVTPPDTTPPTAPGDLQVVARSDTEVDVRWAAASDDVAVSGYEIRRADEAIARVTATNLAHRGLSPATKYCYSLVAIDAAGNRSAPSSPACVTTPDLKPPSVPQHVSAIGRPPSSLVVAWEASADDVKLAGYEVFFQEGPNSGERMLAQVGGTSITHSSLQAGQRYCYRVRAYDQAGNRSAHSAPPVCAVMPDYDPPSRPENLIVQASSDTRLAVGWTPSTDNAAVTRYELLRGGKVIAKSSEASATESGLQPEQQYCYAVRAFDGAGNESPLSEEACGRTTVRGAPAAPYQVRATLLGENEVSLVWHPSSTPGVVYRVYTAMPRKPLAAVGVTKSVSFTDATPRPPVRRCYSVSAVDAEGRESGRSLESCVTGAASGAPAAKPTASASP